MNQTGNRLLALFLALSALLSLTACGGGENTAATMHLIKTEGTVRVDDDQGKSVTLMDNLGLYSGYRVATQAVSYGWINLDGTKLTKLDENSEAEIQKEGKLLEIYARSGNLFFNVTKPLEADETMNIRTSTMLVSIRGTCGWVEVEGESLMCLYLLKGQVECTVLDKDGGVLASETITAGQAAKMEAIGSITVAEFDTQNVPTFVRDEAGEDTSSTAPEPASDAPNPSSPEPVLDVLRLREMYTYSRTVSYNQNGDLMGEGECFPDEQGRIGKSVTDYGVTVYVYNDEGTLQTLEADNGVIYTVTENTADHRKMVRGDMDWEYIEYYDEQGHETRQELFANGEMFDYRIFTYDAEGKLIRSDRYLADGSLDSYILYAYD